MCKNVLTNQNTAGKSNFSSISLEKCPFKEILFIILFFFSEAIWLIIPQLTILLQYYQ